MWLVVALFVIAAACGVAGRKWGRYLYLHYGRHLLPRSMLTAKNRSPTPPLSPTKDDQSLEALLDESGEMHETVRNPSQKMRRYYLRIMCRRDYGDIPVETGYTGNVSSMLHH